MKKLFLFKFLICLLFFINSVQAKKIYVVPNGIANFTTQGSGSQTLPYNLMYGLYAAAANDSVLLNGTFNRTEQIYIAYSNIYIGSWGTQCY